MNDEIEVAREPHGIDRHMLETLICPLTQSTLIWDSETNELISLAAGIAYPVRNGVPIMVESEARVLRESERAHLKAKRR